VYLARNSPGQLLRFFGKTRPCASLVGLGFILERGDYGSGQEGCRPAPNLWIRGASETLFHSRGKGSWRCHYASRTDKEEMDNNREVLRASRGHSTLDPTPVFASIRQPQRHRPLSRFFSESALRFFKGSGLAAGCESPCQRTPPPFVVQLLETVFFI